MPKIAISYRRSDSSAIVGRIFDHLSAHYGEDLIFMDIDNIPFGIDFRTHIDETLRRTEVLVAVIGANWLGINAAGGPRMQEKTDPVRVEIATAIGRKLPIIPVLIDGAKMPSSTELPPEFGNFAFLNAAEVATGRDFRTHMDRLISAIDRVAAGDQYAAAPHLEHRTHAAVADLAAPARQLWLSDVPRYFVAPLIVLLVAHHVIVNAFDLNTIYLQIVCAVVPFVFGFALFRLSRRSAGTASGFAVALGLIAVTGMTVSQSLNSGDPVLPQTWFEWWDNVNFAVIIALGFMVGHTLARALWAALRAKQGKP